MYRNILNRILLDLTEQIPALKERSRSWKLKVQIDKNHPLHNERMVPLGLLAHRKYKRIFADPVYAGLRRNSPYKPGEISELYTCYARETVADMLAKAADLLPEGYALVVYDAYRSKETQKRLYDYYYNQVWADHPEKIKDKVTGECRLYTEEDASEETQQFVSLPDIENMPHGTGGAVDAAIVRFADDKWRELQALGALEESIGDDPTREEEIFAIHLRRHEIFRDHAIMANMGPAYDVVALDKDREDITAFEYFEKLKKKDRDTFPERYSPWLMNLAVKTKEEQNKFIKRFRDEDLLQWCNETIKEQEKLAKNPPDYLRAAFSFTSPLKTDVVFSIRLSPEMHDKFMALSEEDQRVQLNALGMSVARKHLFEKLRQSDVMENLKVFSGEFDFHAAGADAEAAAFFKARMEKIRQRPDSDTKAASIYKCYDEWLRLCENKMIGREMPLAVDWTKDAGYEASIVFSDTKHSVEAHQNGFTPLNKADTEALWMRRMLYHVMTAVGFKIYAAESWHGDFGNKFAGDVKDEPRSCYGYAELSEENCAHNLRVKNIYKQSVKLAKKAGWVRELYEIVKNGPHNSGRSPADQPKAGRISPPKKPKEPQPIKAPEPVVR